MCPLSADTRVVGNNVGETLLSIEEHLYMAPNLNNDNNTIIIIIKSFHIYWL